MSFIEFIQWCFRSQESGATTVIILLMTGAFVLEVISRLTKK